MSQVQTKIQSEEVKPKSEVRLSMVLISVLVAIGFSFIPPPEGLTPDMMKFIGIFIAMEVGLIGKAAPAWIVTTVSAMAVIAIGLSNFSTMMANWSDSSIWMMIAIMGFAVSLSKCGLTSRIAYNVLKMFPASVGQTMSIGAASAVLTPLIPSTGAKLGVLGPFVSEVGIGTGIKPHSRQMVGLWFVYYTIIRTGGFCLLTGSNANPVMLGFASDPGKFTWGFWLQTFVVWFVIMVVLTLLFALIFFRQKKQDGVSDGDYKKKLNAPPPMSRDEKYCSIVLACAIFLWATESFHGVASVIVAWAALAAMVIRGLFTSKDLL